MTITECNGMRQINGMHPVTVRYNQIHIGYLSLRLYISLLQIADTTPKGVLLNAYYTSNKAFIHPALELHCGKIIHITFGGNKRRKNGKRLPKKKTFPNMWASAYCSR